jgi:hypothetical protein
MNFRAIIPRRQALSGIVQGATIALKNRVIAIVAGVVDPGTGLNEASYI